LGLHSCVQVHEHVHGEVSSRVDLTRGVECLNRTP
jgi:hypothetical protein